MAAYRVLIVDDNHEVRRMVTASIKTLGAEIDVLNVPSAEEALFISTSQPLDLVVIDIRLPGMSDLEMVDRLLSCPPLVVVYSSF
jgi:CheY-like chemotaxis protein